MQKQLRNSLLAFVTVSFFTMIIFADIVSAATIDSSNLKSTIQPKGYFSQSYKVFNEKVLPNSARDFYFYSNLNIDLYFLNGQTFAVFLNNGTLPITASKANTTSVNEFWSADVLHDTYGIALQKDAANETYAEVYVLIINTHTDESANIIVRLNYTPNSEFLKDIHIFVKYLVVFIYVMVGAVLHKRASEAKKEKNLNRASILAGQGTAYALVGAIFFLADLRNYIENEYGTTSIKSKRIEFIQANFPIQYYDIYIALIFLSAAAIFMALCFVVEKNVKHRKIPIVTYNLLVAALLSLLIFVFPPIVVFALMYLVVSVLAAVAQVIYVYLEMVIKNPGQLRRNSLFILLGILLPLLAFITRIFLFNIIRKVYEVKSDIYILVDLMALMGVYFFYQGNMIPENS